MTILLIAAVLVAIASSHALPHYVTEELAAMVHKVISVHFTMSKCVALITEDNTKLMDDIHPLQIPVLHVNLTLSFIKNSERLPTGALYVKIQKRKKKEKDDNIDMSHVIIPKPMYAICDLFQ